MGVVVSRKKKKEKKGNHHTMYSGCVYRQNGAALSNCTPQMLYCNTSQPI